MQLQIVNGKDHSTHHFFRAIFKSLDLAFASAFCLNYFDLFHLNFNAIVRNFLQIIFFPRVLYAAFLSLNFLIKVIYKFYFL